MPRDLFAPQASQIARVALPLPVDQLFDYAVPAALASRAEIGRRVRVRAGRQTLVGVIAELADGDDRGESARGSLRALEAVVDEEPVLSLRLIRVLRDEASALLCPVGVALHSAIPAGSTPRAARVYEPSARGRAALAQGVVPGAAGRLLAALAQRPRSALALRRGPEDEAAALPSLERDGLVTARIDLGAPAVRAATERVARLAEGVDAAAAQAACEGVLRRAPRQSDLLRVIALAEPIPTHALAERLRASGADARDPIGTLRKLVRRGLARVERRAPEPEGARGLEEADRELVLTAEQQAAVDRITACVHARRADRFLLHGVTGSGKTEVYLRAVAEALAAGRQALVLVPEITLTHQIVGRLRARFGDQLAVLHSGLRPAERLAQWERLRRGQTPIAVGARSALFAPTADLGLIVVDEEHDSAYKNDEGFRYHARGLAARRAAADGCPLVLGSATPSLETRRGADTGALERLVLRARIEGRPLPSVELVDLARERAVLPRGRKLILSGALRRALARVLADGGQSILFLNRRGFSTQIACFACQHVARCKHCDISLTYHAASERLRCHYCDYQRVPPEVCPECGSNELSLLGLGTERLEEEVRTQLPDARVARLDRDVSARRGAVQEVLTQLRDGEIDVLVGTQMVAKGHDFPGVRLVGVINADLGLHMPDFRAAERCFQLLTQVSGRAGRGAVPGRVIVQTFSPDHYAIRPVVGHDYETFYQQELEHRRALGYPPFGQLALVRVTGTDEGLATVAAERIAKAARQAAARAADAAPCEVLGPAPAPIARLRGRHRIQLLLKHPRSAVLREVARELLPALDALPGDTRASLDLRPLDML